MCIFIITTTVNLLLPWIQGRPSLFVFWTLLAFAGTMELWFVERVLARRSLGHLTALVLSLFGFLLLWVGIIALTILVIGFRLETTPAPAIATMIGVIAAGSVSCAVAFSTRIVKQGEQLPTPAGEHKVKVQRGLLTINYSELLDPDEIVRTGQKLKSALNNRALVQPFVDRYSDLLPATLELINRPGKAPYSTVLDLFPMGEVEPAWVALVRGGRIHISWDGETRAQLFLLGDHPKQAYEEAYSTVRHCLEMLSELAEADLHVDIFSYKHDYQSSKLTLNLEPYSIKSASFQSSKKLSLDLSKLDHFFSNNAQLEGATLKENEGLELIGKEVDSQTLAGTRIDLCDLAVAYRAVLHSGDNRPFVSLDTHRDPTKARVNFGGFLENTRLGAVLLEADKRFKAVTSGLDPNPPYADIRKYTRRYVTEFLSSHERELLRFSSTRIKWIGTRFWFYADSIKIITNSDSSVATIVSPRFTADAERSRDDFTSKKEYEKHKQDTLLPSHRINIDHLNKHYAEYAQAFPELRELDTAARLLAVCKFILELNPPWLDCDELLSVELPVFRTESERTRLISATFLTTSEVEPASKDRVVNESVIVNLSPILESNVGDYFGSPDGVARWSAEEVADGSLELTNKQASVRFFSYRDRKVGEMLADKKELEAFAGFAAGKVQSPASLAATELDAEILQNKNEVESLAAELQKLGTRADDLVKEMNVLKRAEDTPPSQIQKYSQLCEEQNRLAEEHNRRLPEYAELAAKCQESVKRRNSLKVIPCRIIGISGGVSADPGLFYFQKSESSPEFITFESMYQKTNIQFTEMPNRERWIKSEHTATSPGEAAKRRLASAAVVRRASKIHRRATLVDAAGTWRVDIVLDTQKLRERIYSGNNGTIRIREFSSGQEQTIVGQWDSADSIIFGRPKINGESPEQLRGWGEGWRLTKTMLRRCAQASRKLIIRTGGRSKKFLK